MNINTQKVVLKKYFFPLWLAALLIMLMPILSSALDVPDFLDTNDISDAEFMCMTDSVEYSVEDQKYVDMLWDETLTYLKGIALALTNDEVSNCINSDEAIYDTAGGIKRMCIMDRRDMKLMVKNIYQVINTQTRLRSASVLGRMSIGYIVPEVNLKQIHLLRSGLNGLLL